jgi:1,4-dihydroxy-6-naphthoate synthase
MMKNLTLGISTCPNDTFVFDAWINNRMKDAPSVRCSLKDISELNRIAMNVGMDIIKVSFFAYGFIKEKYRLLNAGGALGRGCGPVVVVRPGISDLKSGNIRIALPGELTTANLLFSLYRPEIKNKFFMKFDEIMPAVSNNEVDAGVVIHEGRFTFEDYGLVLLKDLGAWWEYKTGFPVPLGAIVARKTLGEDAIESAELCIRKSLKMALSDPEISMPFMRKFAGEMDDNVLRSHVDLYVNNFTFDFGEEGRKAIDLLLEMAEERGLFDKVQLPAVSDRR